MRLIFFNSSFISSKRQINALDASDGKKIRYKVVLALNHVNTDLYNPRSFDDVPLEMMPYLLTMIQQDIGYNGFGKDIAPKNMPNMDTAPYRSYGRWNPETRRWGDDDKTYYGRKNPLTGKIEMKGEISKDTKSLSRVFEVIMSSQSLPQLFSRGPGEFKFTNKGDSTTTTAKKTEKKKNKSKSKKRKKFGDADDDDDDAWIPKGARKTAKYVWNPESRKYTRIPPPVY